MKLRLGLRTKMVLFFAPVIVVVFSVAFWMINKSGRDISVKNSEEIVELKIIESTKNAELILNEQMDVIVHIKSFLEGDDVISNPSSIDHYTKLLSRNALKDNPDFLSVWVSWELNHIDKNYNLKHGRKSYSINRNNGQFFLEEELKEQTNEDVKGDYYLIKNDPRPVLFEPYKDKFDSMKDSVLMASLAIPLEYKDEFVGLIGVDIALEKFQKIVSELKPYENSKAFMLTQDGIYISHYNKEYISKNIANIFKEDNERYGITDSLNTGEPFAFYNNDNEKDRFFVSFVPIKVRGVDENWYIGVRVPEEVLLSDSKASLEKGRLIVGGVVGILILIIWIVSNMFTKPLRSITNIMKRLAEGNILTSMKVKVESNDEVGDMMESVNTLIDGLNNTCGFAQSIGDGDLDSSYVVLGDDDRLGMALLDMRDSLKKAKVLEEERKLEGEQQQWTSSGLAMFASLLRENQDDVNEFAYSVLSNLLKYIGANMGGFYLIEEEDGERYLELKASVAYEQRKFIDQRIEMGIGLVGQCLMEKESIYLTDVPKDYIKIVSGLGSESPDCVFIIPLMVNENVYGVIEIAAFKVFEDYERDFIEKIGESVASTISSVRTNIRTKQLLEESKEKSEELASQEEEMRQNMEELQATQEEAFRKSEEMQNFLNSLSRSNFFIEYDLSGKIVEVNDKYAEMFSLSRDEMIGMSFFDDSLILENKDEVWRNILIGQPFKSLNKIDIKGFSFTLLETYTPIIDSEDKVVKVLKISNDLREYSK